jgi:hypothetical protein
MGSEQKPSQKSWLLSPLGITWNNCQLSPFPLFRMQALPTPGFSSCAYPESLYPAAEAWPHPRPT